MDMMCQRLIMHYGFLDIFWTQIGQCALGIGYGLAVPLLKTFWIVPIAFAQLGMFIGF